MERKFKSLPVGVFEVNCYLVPSPSGKILYIIDPGDEPENIAEYTKDFQYEEAVILLTHAHVDHITGIAETAKRLNVKKVYIHPDDLEMYRSPENALPPYFPAAADLPEPAAWPPEDPAMEIIHTPGHTPGGVCYYFRDYGAVFSGDTLFRASVGRTDLPGGSETQLIESVRKLLAALPDETAVMPGHGYESSIGFEKENNPYI